MTQCREVDVVSSPSSAFLRKAETIGGSMSEKTFNPAALSKALAEELRLLKESLPLAQRRATEASRGDLFGGAAKSARKAQLADEKVQAIRRRIADIQAFKIR
jgi:hypothetical protein